MAGMIFDEKKKKVKGNIFCFLMMLFLLCEDLFAQQTNNLQVVWQKTSPESVLCFGRCIASGDVNGDGFSDIMIVGDSMISLPGQPPAIGKCWVFYSGPNLDTIPDVQLLNFRESYFQAPIFTALHSSDINGDGFDDVILGACHNIPEDVLVFLGGNPMDSSCDYRIRVPLEGEFGCAVSSSDVNGDGYEDLIVGASATPIPPAGWGAGRVYIYFGGPNFDMVPDVILNGGHHNDQ
jgi:hypothetical protein